MSAGRNNPKKAKSKSNPKSHEKYEKAAVRRPGRGPVYTVFLASCGVPMNLFGSNPRMLWFFSICFCGVILYETHVYVSGRILAMSHRSPPKNPESGANSSVTSSDQKGGFTGINYGTVNQAPPAELPPTIDEQIAAASKIAQARMWMPPEIPAGTMFYVLKFGGMQEVRSVVWPSPPAMTYPGGNVVSPYVVGRRLYVTAQSMLLGDDAGTVTLNNEWPLKLPAGYDRNFNENLFEIVDNTQLPVLQVRYRSPNEVEVYGIFVGPTGAVTMAFGDRTVSVNFGLSIPTVPERKAWFKYPSDRNQGILADP